MEIADVLAQAEDPEYARVATARILLRQDLTTRHAELETALAAAIEADAMSNRAPTSPAIAAELAELEDAIEAAKVEFRFKAMGARAWADLMRDHPPTKDDKRIDPRIDHNPRTFPAVALAASCIDPVMTVDDARRLEATLSTSLFQVLWVKCIDANVGGVANPKSSAAGVILRANERYASTPAPAASPDRSSLAESSA